MKIWSPTPNRWIVILDDGSLVDVSKDPSTDRFYFQAASGFEQITDITAAILQFEALNAVKPIANIPSVVHT